MAHKTIISMEVISDDPYEFTSLEQLAYDITNGDCSGYLITTQSVLLTDEELRKECAKHGTDPEFFNSTEIEI